MRILSKWFSVSVDGGRNSFRYLMFGLSGFTAVTLGCFSFRDLISSCWGAVGVNTMTGIWGNLDSSSVPIIENAFLNYLPLIIINTRALGPWVAHLSMT